MRTRFSHGTCRYLRALPLLVGLAACDAVAAERLPALGADLDATTVSGVSAGGYMAVQFHVAYSATVLGAGALAAGPYYCARGNVYAAYHNCMNPGAWTPLPAVAELVDAVDTLAAGGLVDPPRHLASDRVWLFWGTHDRTVDRPVVEALRRFYLRFVAAANVVLVEEVPAGHGMVTLDAGGACAATASPYIVDCDFDAAGRMLAHLFGPLAPPAAGPAGRLLEFDQSEFAHGDAFAISMADTGFAYVPERCAAERCRVHVAFHGCRQNAQMIGERFVREGGYNRWADANRIVVLYPQTIARSGWGRRGWRWSFVVNPRGCWDWWGYTGSQYHTRDGLQMRAVRAMLERLAAPR
ncbi:MAG: PHB depolymerase family esterase [Burkholderiales bacterium]|nr:PHB depolymerase family esterase [Burkholderiales bacterium]